MSEEIIITTESVKISELHGREKQIYEYAYRKGYVEGTEYGTSLPHRIVSYGIVFIMGIFFFYCLFTGKI